MNIFKILYKIADILFLIFAFILFWVFLFFCCLVEYRLSPFILYIGYRVTFESLEGYCGIDSDCNNEYSPDYPPERDSDYDIL